MPRMTDSMAHQAGPGPSSLKLAALSANSYHLDSPPFTGTAGPLGENIDDIERLNSSLRNAALDIEDGHNSEASGDQTPAAAFQRMSGSRERMSTGGSVRQHQRRQSQVMQDGLNERNEAYARDQHALPDRDVPRWHLDDPRHQQQQQREATTGNAAVEEQSPHIISHSLSPPPFSSAGQGPFSTASTLKGSSTLPLDPSSSSRSHIGRGHRRRESSRPSFTQISDSNSASNDDAASATADGDADADEDVNEAEADGDETAYVVRNPMAANGATSKVPTQSQTKVSKIRT
jgi:nicotinamide mononucleotide adenylyltransferase